ncbi:hypothetical protein M3231_21005 [Neobacillus mesonae]|nr:hypothetical protein [Neobacillus mesonae]
MSIRFTRFMALVCSLLVTLLALLPAQDAFAADQKWINQVWSDYKAYNKKTVNAYNAYQKQADKVYKQLNDKSSSDLDELEQKVLKDQEEWVQQLEADLEQLKLKYGGSTELADELAKYERYINPSYLNSPMYTYTKAADRNYLNSTMWRLSKALDENYLNSLMWKYSRTIDSNYLNSSAWKFKNTVDENYLNSPMWKLRNGSDKNYLNSPIWKYSKGKISKATAKSSYNKLFKAQTAASAKSNAQRKQEISDIAASTKTKVAEIYNGSVQSLEQQREETLRSISELRKSISGEGLVWEPLLTEQ